MKRYKELSRPKKAALNLALAVVLLFGLWACFDYPLPSAELQFRRMERQNMRQPSDIVFRLDRNYNPVTGAIAQISNVYVGICGDEAVAGYFQNKGASGNYMEVWPLGDGPSPVPLSYPVSERHESGYLMTGNALLFFNIPPAAVDAQLEIRTEGGPSERAQGERLEKEGFYFWFSLQDSEEQRDYGREHFEEAPYTLWLYDASGNLILEQEDAIPKI